MRAAIVGLLLCACSGPAGGGTGGGQGTAGGGASASAGGAAGGAAGGSTAGGATAGGATAGGSTAGGASAGGSTAGGSTAGGSATGDAGTPLAIAVGYGQRIARSTDGMTWTMTEKTAMGGDDNDLFRGVGFGEGRFVAVGGSSVALTRVSTDGVQWLDGGTGRAWLGGAAFTGTVWVAAGGNGLRVRSTDHGTTWTNDPGYQAMHYRAVAAGPGRAVAVGHTYNLMPNVGVITTTADGITWSERRQAGAQFGTVAFGNGVFVACTSATVCATSSDGMTWVDHNVGTGDGSVVFTGTEFIVVRSNGTFRSSDGAQWTNVNAMSRGVAGFFNGAYFSFDWPLRIQRSTNLSTWTPVFQPMGSGLTQLVVGAVP